MMPSARSRPGVAWITLASCLAITFVLYRSTLASTYALWSQNPLSLGYLVIPTIGYLTWRRRQRLAAISPRPDYRALPCLALIALIWLIGSVTGTDIVQQVSLIAIVMALIWGIAGSDAIAELMFPLAFLVFALQVGDRFIPSLQNLTARSAVKLLQLSGVPVLLEGHVISIPGSRWQVADACSGINYLTSSLAVGYLYAGLVYRRWSHRLAFVAASAILPLAANGVRVYATIFIASLGATGIASGMEHYLFGYVVFAAILWLLLVSCGRWREDEVPNPRRPDVNRVSANREYWLRCGPIVAACGLVLVAMAPLATRSLLSETGAVATARPTRLEISSPWTSLAREPYTWKPRFAGTSAEALQSYFAGGRVVTVYVASYASRQPGVKLASATNLLFEDPWWATAEGERMTEVNGQQAQVRETVIRSPQSSLVLWSWYWVDGRPTSSDYLAKVLLAKARLQRSPQGSAAMAIATDAQSPDEAAIVLADFAKHMTWVGPIG